MEYLPDSPPRPPVLPTPPAAEEDHPHAVDPLDPQGAHEDAPIADDEPSYSHDEWYFPLSPWDTLPQAGISLLLAKRGVGASTFARTLAFWLASGRGFEPLWGDGTRDESVWYWMLTLRDDPRWRERVEAIFAPVEEWQGNLRITVGMPYHNPYDDVKKAIAERKFAILDALPEFRPVHQRRVDLSLIINGLRSIAEKNERSILGILPLSGREKITEDTPYLYQRMYGVDTVFLLRDRSGTRTFTVTGPVGENLGESVLHYDNATNRVEIGDAWREIADTAIGNAISDALSAGPCTERELEARIGGKRAEIARVLRRLVATRVVTRTGSGKRGDPYRYDQHRRSGGSRGSRGSSERV